MKKSFQSTVYCTNYKPFIGNYQTLFEDQISGIHTAFEYNSYYIQFVAIFLL